MNKDDQYGPIVNLGGGLRGGLRVPLDACKAYHETITVSSEGDGIKTIIIYLPWGQAEVTEEVEEVIKVLDSHNNCFYEDL